MSRFTPYFSKPDENWRNIREILQSTTLFLMARNGPCVFTIGDENGHSYRSVLGNPNICSCLGLPTSSLSASSSENKMCIHVMYCLLKVLKIKENHPLAYQNSYMDNELDQLCSGLLCETVDRRLNRWRQSKTKPADDVSHHEQINADGFVNRQVIPDRSNNDDHSDVDSSDKNNSSNIDYGEDSCPICQDNMTTDQALTWCRKGCGNNMHAKCMQTYCQYNILKKNEPQCPYCRTPWLMEYLKQDCRSYNLLKYTCASISCSSCNFGARGLFYRCIECSQQKAYESITSTESIVILEPIEISQPAIKKRKPVDYCQSCFSRIGRNHSSTHHFLKSDASSRTVDDVVWSVISNPSKNPMDMNILFSLQNRDLNTTDYDTLLGLDHNHTNITTTLPNHVVNSLPIYQLQMEGNRQLSSYHPCWCMNDQTESISNISSFSSSSSVLRILPCSHTAHEQCILNLISDAGDDLICLDKICCKHSECGIGIFRGLSRRRREKKKPIVNLTISNSSSVETPSTSLVTTTTTIGHSINHRHSNQLSMAMDSMMSIHGIRVDNIHSTESNRTSSTTAHFNSSSLKESIMLGKLKTRIRSHDRLPSIYQSDHEYNSSSKSNNSNNNHRNVHILNPLSIESKSYRNTSILNHTPNNTTNHSQINNPIIVNVNSISLSSSSQSTRSRIQRRGKLILSRPNLSATLKVNAVAKQNEENTNIAHNISGITSNDISEVLPSLIMTSYRSHL